MTGASATARSPCRICRSDSLELLLDLGAQPLANAFLREDELNRIEERYPLEFCRCRSCGHTQLSLTVSPEVMFRNYLYVSGTSETIPSHFAAYARDVERRFMPDGGFIVEIGSNDGTLLRAFDPARFRVLGIEPARNIAGIAMSRGIATRNDFYSARLADQVSAEYGHADAILANNVVAHIHDLHDLVRGIGALLAPTGVFVAEFPYVVDLLERVEYDTIYHEHLSYFSVGAAADLFRRFGLTLFDVERVAVHGGSLRIFVARGRPEGESVQRLIAGERALRIHERDPYEQFARKVADQRRRLGDLLGGLKRGGKRIVAYGAPAKGNTLLNFCGIDSAMLEYTVDRSPLKQGLYTPGTHLQVLATEHLALDRPDYALLLSWNFADEILRQQASYLDKGGRFIVPIPVPRII